MKKLTVVYKGWGECWPLGTLADDGRRLLFEYSAQALRQGLELSPRHLPLQPAAMGDFPLHQMRLPGLVADALPDGWGLLVMDRLFRRTGRNPSDLSPLDRLAFIGDRAMGALGFEPAQGPDWEEESLELLALARASQDILKAHEAAVQPDDGPTVLKRMAVLGGSPHGARPKVLVFLEPTTGRIAAQPFEGASPWLVKFQAQGEHPEVCSLEALYAELARHCGLDMRDTRAFMLDRRLAAFGAQRFDRDGAHRVPVHTLAGLLNADFRLPSSVDATTFLRATRFLTRSQAEVDEAFRRIVFNVVFHNRDDHPRNLSYRLGADRQWRLAPAYDLTFSQGPGGEHQMDVVGCGRDVRRAHLMSLAQQGGVSAESARAMLDRALSVAGDFEQHAQGHAIRRSTVRTVRVALERVRACLT